MSGMITGPGPWFARHAEPVLPAGHMKTYQVIAPVSTHFRPATCEEVMCPAFIYGWVTIVPADSEAASFIRHDSSRRHTEAREPDGRASFTFPPGQEGFRGGARSEHDHKVRLDRPEVYLVRGGDFRGNPRGEIRRHVRADDWVDDFATHQDKLATRLERG